MISYFPFLLIRMVLYVILQCPDTAFYIPNFLSNEEEVYLLDRVYSVPKPKWTQLTRRRLQNWGGIPHPNGMISEPIPQVLKKIKSLLHFHHFFFLQWLQCCMDKVANLGIFGEKKPNHVLINEYKPNEGIMVGISKYYSAINP